MNQIPIIGWLISFGLNTSLAVPFWLCWTVLDVGADYFYWLPETDHSIGFWDCIWIFIVVEILKLVLVPKIANVDNSSNIKAES